MSSSFLKPSVTPCTAFAMRLRARPWYLASSGSSVDRFACSVPSASSKLMPLGNGCRILPFGPCTSTSPSATLTVTPFGIVIGFLPIRDMFVSRRSWWSRVLPDITEHFAADADLDGFPPGHHAARRGQDAGAEPGQHLGHVVVAEIDTAAGAADPLDSGDEPLPVRPVFQEHPQHLADGRRLAGRRVQELEALDIPLVLQDAGDVGLDARGRHVDACVLRAHGIPDPREHVCDRISHICYLTSSGRLVIWSSGHRRVNCNMAQSSDDDEMTG